MSRALIPYLVDLTAAINTQVDVLTGGPSVFNAYGRSLEPDEGDLPVEEWACFIDLSDTSNWPHTQTGHIDIETLSLNIDKTTNAFGSVALGVITRIDGTDADVTLFFGKGFNNSNETGIEISRVFGDGRRIKTKVENGNTPFMMTTARLTSITALNTATPIDSALGTGTVTPAVGDIVARFLMTAGTKYSCAFQAFYTAEAAS